MTLAARSQARRFPSAGGEGPQPGILYPADCQARARQRWTLMVTYSVRRVSHLGTSRRVAPPRCEGTPTRGQRITDVCIQPRELQEGSGGTSLRSQH